MKTGIRQLGGALALALGLVLLPSISDPQSPVRPQLAMGQSATLLPDGHWLFLGGQGPQGPLSTAMIWDANTQTLSPVRQGLELPRAGHSATVLPDGTVIIVGGVGEDGRIVIAAERFDPRDQSFETLGAAGPAPRAYHTATLLTDGRLLIVGGFTPDETVQAQAELWDPRSGTSEVVPGGPTTPRAEHSATLLGDGSVLIWGGRDGSGAAVSGGELLQPGVGGFSGIDTTPPRAGSPVNGSQVAGTVPQDSATDVPTSPVLAFRFSGPMQVETVTSQTVILNGPQGVEPATVVPAEGGMLVFVTPQEPLRPGTSYSLSINGAADPTGALLPFTMIWFTTESAPAGSIPSGALPGGSRASASSAPVTATGNRPDASGRADQDDWEWKGERRNGRPYSQWQSLPPLEAAPGVTALAGQVLRLNGEPLANVTLQMERGPGAGLAQTRTDSTGRFLLEGVGAGRQELLIDGRSASVPGRTYGVFEVGVEIVGGKTTGLGYTVWMPRIDTAHAVTIPTYTPSEIVVTTPRIPGLELRLPAHSGIRDHEGKPATQISITPIPRDRPPFPLPPRVDTPAYFTVQPGAGYVYSREGAGARVIYPNFANAQRALPGTRFQFWHYDAGEKGWHVYGLGTVTEDGGQVVPDPKVTVYEFTGAMAAPAAVGYAQSLAAANLVGGDPVDLGTGLFVMRKTDLVLPDVIPIVLTRTHRGGDTLSRAFGLGATHPYDMFLVGDFNPYTYLDLFLPDGTRIHFDRIPPGTDFADAVYEHTSTPTRFQKARITWNWGHVGWDLSLKDGTLYEFPEASGAPRSMWAALTGYRDRYGNALTLTRDGNRDLTRLTTPGGRWVELTVDASHRITQAQDNIGRTVSYTYDAAGRLSTVTDAAGGVTTYGYDASNRMATITDARGIAYLTNEYDTTGKVIRQTQPGGIVHQLAYTLGPGGIVTQTDVTDPRGGSERATFNDAGYPLSDTRALGAPEQQTTSYEWQAGTNLLLAQTDALGRRTAYAYDTTGNLTSLTRLAGTADAVTTGFTYEPTFSQVASVTDPLGHTTTLGYDGAGNPTTITTPLGVATTLTYTAAGQPLTITTPAGTTQLGYDLGDLVSITDPLGRATTRFTDNAGRLVSVTDARGSQTRYAYDALNRLTRITDALGGVTQLGYDPNGNLLTVTDARGSVTGYSYDAMDRVATRTDPLLRTESYQYDLAGNLTQVTDRRSQVTTVSYDALNRRTGATYADTSTTSYGYDAGNRLRTVTDSLAGTLTLTYDTLDRLTQEGSPQGTVSYSYDAAGRRTSMGIPGQPAVTYGYDAADRLLQITKGSALVTFGYDAADRRTLLALPNGVTTEYTYDVASQLTGLTYKKGAATLGTLAYAYDLAGNRTQVSGSWARTGLPDAVPSASYNAANHQLALGPRAMTYDLAGNLLSLAEPTGTTAFTWNARNQLSAMTTPDGTASFLYDGLGRRRAKTINGTRTDFLYDGLTPVQELPGGSAAADLLTGLGIDEYFTRTTGATTRTLLTDALGATVALTDDTGALQAEYTYEPFGATTETGADSNPFQYTGREHDSTGLYYYRARYYHPGLQRFTAEDPIGFGGSDFNLYAYVRNNPLRNRDPLGLTSEAVCVALDSIGSSLVSVTPSLAGRKDDLAPAVLDQARIILAAAPRRDQLSRCLDACEAGGRAIENFCRSLPDPRARGLCWASRWSVPVCKGMCYALFGT